MSVLNILIPVPAGGDGPIVDVSVLSGPKTVLLSGTFDGSYVLLGSQDGVLGSFVPVAQFDSGSGPAGIEQTVPGAFRFFQMRSLADAVGAVTCHVSGITGEGTNYFAQVAVLGAGFTGLTAPIDTWALFPPTGIEADVCFLCAGEFRGQVVVLGSMDNLAYEPVGAFRIDTVPAGFGGNYELEPLVTLDKVRYLRLNVDGVTSGSTTVTVGGFVPSGAAPPSPAPPVASWDPTLVRFIFLDGDGGDDNHAGYIDAPAGTVFTPAQAAAVAVKTTHRINEIRPAVGAGRSVVVLFKPRAGNASYENTPGDGGDGAEDRGACVGYRLMITRGSSDLTNSAADWKGLGSVPAIVGPNGDGSFTVAAVVDPTPDYGLALSLTGATLPGGPTLRAYRARLQTASSGVLYGPIQWGDPADVPDQTKVLLSTIGAGVVAPGDKVWFERPGATILNYTEAADASGDSGCLRAYGLVVAGSAVLGPAVAKAAGHYNYVWVGGGSASASITNRGEGDVIGDPLVFDEGGNFVFGNEAPSIWGPLTTFLDTAAGFVSMQNATFSDAAGGSGQQTFVSSRSVTLVGTALQNAAITSTGGGGTFATACLLGLISDTAAVRSSFRSSRVVPTWRASVGASFVVTGYTNGQNAAEPGYEFDNIKTFWGVEPDLPSIELLSARYAVYLNMTYLGTGPGNGIVVDSEIATGGIPVLWESLSNTGFDIVNRQRVIVHIDWSGYLDGLLPCPRCEIMRVVDAETSGTIFDVGLSVGTSLSVPGRIDIASAALGGIMPTGVLAAACTQGGLDDPNLGWAIVAMDKYLVIKAEDSIVTPPVTGELLFLSGLQAGQFTTTDPRPGNIGVILGRAISVGPQGGLYYACHWNPVNETGRSQVQLAVLSAPFQKTDDSLTSVTDLTCQLETNRQYALDAYLPFDCVANGLGGTKIAFDAVTIDSARLNYTLFQRQAADTSTVPAITVNGAKTGFGDSAEVDNTSSMSGYWHVVGSVTVGNNSGGQLIVRFAQQTTNATASTLEQGAYLKITEE